MSTYEICYLQKHTDWLLIKNMGKWLLTSLNNILCDVITHPLHYFSGSSGKLLVKLGYGWVITVQCSMHIELLIHYSDVRLSAIASQITGVSIVYPTVCSGADQRKLRSSASLAFVKGIYRWLLNFPHQGPVTRKCSHLMTSSWHVLIPMLL